MWLARALTPLLDLVYPWACPVCKDAFEATDESPGPLCATCLKALERIENEPHCLKCTHPLPMHGSPCPAWFGKGPPNYFRVVRLGAYAPPLQDLIIQLKYHKRWGIGEELADRLLATEAAKEVLQETEVLIAVPLHWKRRLTRWYNQAEVAARRLAKKCGIQLAHPVRRKRNTETQTHLHSRAKRERNLRDAFELIDPKAIAGKHVTVVDDVWTTGSTMQALARTLKPAKPKSLSALVLAAADPRGYERVEKREESM